MLAALGVSCVCSGVPRAKSDRVRVENALCRSIRVAANGANNVRTAFWRTTGADQAVWAHDQRTHADDHPISKTEVGGNVAGSD